MDGAGIRVGYSKNYVGCRNPSNDIGQVILEDFRRPLSEIRRVTMCEAVLMQPRNRLKVGDLRSVLRGCRSATRCALQAISSAGDEREPKADFT